MSKKSFPLTNDQLQEVIKKHPTPFYIYDEAAIRATSREFYEAFDWVPTVFKNYYAVKALPNPHILKILHEEGMGADCSSLPELILAEMVGMKGEEILLTSNNTPLDEFEKALEMGAVINLDDITHIQYLEQLKLPELLSFRYNPGPLKSGNEFIGNPEEAKYGLTKEQLIDGFKTIKKKGVKRFGLHTMVASNELNSDYFIETASLLLETIAEISDELKIHFDFLNLGGGIGIPYKPEEEKVDLAKVSHGIKKLYSSFIVSNAMKPPKLYFECGRVITGPNGWLVTNAIHHKNIYKNYIGVDSCMADLMRPGMYGAYHHITVMGKEDLPEDHKYDVTGSLCENCDKFAIDRMLPKITEGDTLIIHDAGAHGRAMGFNYNAKLRPAELLLKENGEVVEIRRRETIEDYFSTLDLSKF